MPAATDHFPREIQFSENCPPRTVIQMTHPGTCRYCGEAIAMYRSVWLLFDVAHTGTERSRCATEAFHLATYVPTCPDCGGPDLVTNTTDPWADVTTCPCGYTHRRSLGD